jgi:DNA repair exonuclease SbcCD ATPase subunit
MSSASTEEVEQKLQHQYIETKRLSDEHSKCEDKIQSLQKQIRSLESEKRKAQAEANTEAELVEELNEEIETLKERLRTAKSRELELRELLDAGTAQEQTLRSQLQSITKKLLQAAEHAEERFDQAEERQRRIDAKLRQQEARPEPPTSSGLPPSSGSFGPDDGPLVEMESGKELSDEGGYPSAQAKNRARDTYQPRKSHRYSNSTDTSRRKEVKDKAKKTRQELHLVRSGNDTSAKLGV